MQRFKFSHHLITLSLSVAFITAIACTICEKNNYLTVKAQQVRPQKYIIKPLNLGISSEIHARSTRSLQVRITDENDRPVPDTPVLFLLGSGGMGSNSVGSFTGQTSLRAITNSQGVAQVNCTAGDIAGSATKLNIQVEGANAVWEGTLQTISALAGVLAPQTTAPLFSSLVAGQMPKLSVARQAYTTTEGKRFSLESMRGKVFVMQFLGTWCGISKRQVQSIKNILDGSKAEELQVIGMSVKDPRSTPQAFQQFITDQKVNYSVVKDVADKHFVEFVNSKDVSVPQTLIYGRDGRLIAHFLGFNQQVGAEIERRIKDELGKK